MDPTSAALKAAGPAARYLGKTRLLPIVRGKVLTYHLRRVEPGDNITRIAQALGPPRSSRRQGEHVHHTFDLKIASVLAVTPHDQPTVIAYQVDRRSKYYRPKFNLTPRSGHPLIVRLGKTTYEQAAPPPMETDAMLGANWFTYQELHYQGRPGRYWYYSLRTELSADEPLWNYLRALNDADSDPAHRQRLVDDARRDTRIDGFGISEDGPDVMRAIGLFS